MIKNCPSVCYNGIMIKSVILPAMSAALVKLKKNSCRKRNKGHKNLDFLRGQAYPCRRAHGLRRRRRHLFRFGFHVRAVSCVRARTPRRRAYKSGLRNGDKKDNRGNQTKVRAFQQAVRFRCRGRGVRYDSAFVFVQNFGKGRGKRVCRGTFGQQA